MVFPFEMRVSLTLLLCVLKMVFSAPQIPAESNGVCQCSPWSGNRGSCCPKGTDSCGSAFHKQSCTETHPVCCTSDFGSACCSTDSSCSPGCRNSLQGVCNCVAETSLQSVGFKREDGLHVLGFSAAAECPVADIQQWNCTACKSQGMPLEKINVTAYDGHLAYTGWDVKKERIQVVLRGSTSIQVHAFQA